MDRKYVLRKPVPLRNYRVDYDRELNEEQREVVLAGGGPNLVIAGAGSGKTRTLVYRVSRLIESGTDPSRIVLLTFTNKAAREMLRRVEALLTVDTRRLLGGTFHSVGNRLLRRFGPRVGLAANFTILDPEDARELLEAATSDQGIPVVERRFPKGDVLLDLYSYTINTGRPFPEVLGERAPHFSALEGEIGGVFQRYRERKRVANACDYDDLLLIWKRLLDESPATAAELAASYDHVLVDEYQDTNQLQGELVDGMGRVRRNVTVVGDDAQAIYSFRGASFENILGFPERYPEARTFRLTINYRSTPEILTLANASIAHNARQFAKELSAARESGVLPAVVGLPDIPDQASFVAQRLLEWHDEGEKLSDLAVLYRAHYQALELQIELTRRGIPYEIRSGTRFFEQRHVKDVLAFLKIVVNPKDELSWKRALKLFPRVGERSASAVWQAIGGRPDPLASFREREGSRGIDLPRGAAAALNPLRSLLSRLESPSLRSLPAEAIRAVVDGVYRDFARAKFPNAEARLDELEQFAQFAQSYDSVPAFLEEVTLFHELSGEDVVAGDRDDDRVVLSSVHQAKGLEWSRVILMGLSEGRFPSYRSAATDASLEEERRLFYVAVTRARNEVNLVYPMLARDRYGVDVILEPSRFLAELPVEVYERWTIQSESEAVAGEGDGAKGDTLPRPGANEPVN
ncbi:MAG TPA: ATP-dependent helicase [Thermoanaerobaculia bacterium]|nr:ATP-dependent helicase [Thermoanaerobaculia bacterium]